MHYFRRLWVSEKDQDQVTNQLVKNTIGYIQALQARWPQNSFQQRYGSFLVIGRAQETWHNFVAYCSMVKQDVGLMLELGGAWRIRGNTTHGQRGPRVKQCSILRTPHGVFVPCGPGQVVRKNTWRSFLSFLSIITPTGHIQSSTHGKVFFSGGGQTGSVVSLTAIRLGSSKAGPWHTGVL